MYHKMRVISTGKYDDRGYSNEESIAYLQLQKPADINGFLTYNFGMDDDRFPLSFLTEGQGKAGVVDVDTVQWTWKTMGRLKYTDKLTYIASTSNVGKGGAEFEVHFATHWFIEQYSLIAPDGVTEVRVQKDLGESPYGYAYILKLVSPNPDAVIDPDYLAVGQYWSMSAPTVSESYSKGNRSNVMGVGKMTSQLEFHRYSKEIAGNLANVVTEYEFKGGANGGTQRLWINEEMRQFNIHMRVMDEERLWLAQYNRNMNGEITLKDRDNGKPIPHTSGMLEICRESNYDTYGEYLTLGKLNRTVGDVLSRDTDTGKMDIVLMGGKGFIEDFDYAMKMDAKDNGFLTPLGDKMIKGNGDALEYGAYFRKYKTVEGHTVTVKHASFFDKGTVAEAAKQNGMIHPRTGLPMTSHQAAFIDFSTYEGTKNVRKVRQKGQIYKAKVYKGMTDVPASWGVGDSNFIATDVDMSRYEIKTSLGLQVNNSSKMFLLKCVM